MYYIRHKRNGKTIYSQIKFENNVHIQFECKFLWMLRGQLFDKMLL